MPTDNPNALNRPWLWPWLWASIEQQRLHYCHHKQCQKSWPISSARNGTGELDGSGCTPTGWHHIRIKIGHQAAINQVFIGRRPSGEIYTPELAEQQPQRDWILSRILWLSGDQPGHNRGWRHGQHIDTLHRYIYIHGTPDSEPMGEPRSHGCLRMRNRDIIELFDRVEHGTPIYIGDPMPSPPQTPNPHD